jgi:hypothetical protein
LVHHIKDGSDAPEQIELGDRRLRKKHCEREQAGEQ